MKRKLLLAALLATTTTAFAADGPQVKPWGIYLNYMDTAQKPGDDFFVYGNGAWLKTAKIPSDRSYAGVNLEIDKQNEARLRGIVADLSARKNLSPEETKLRDFYNAFVDQKAIDAAGLKPAQADLTRIAALKTPEDVARDLCVAKAQPLALEHQLGVQALRLTQLAFLLEDALHLSQEPAVDARELVHLLQADAEAQRVADVEQALGGGDADQVGERFLELLR